LPVITAATRRTYEMLYQHDAGVIRLRRYLAQQARKQLIELQAAGK